jgi:hypothetical protein
LSRALSRSLCGSFVFVDEPAENGPAFDPLVSKVDERTLGAWRLELQRPMRTPPVVMADPASSRSITRLRAA